MSLTCEISGESLLNNTNDEIVVTPSGHICIKRLLLTKLTENGGIDPFHDNIKEDPRPLSEDQLIVLQSSSSSSFSQQSNNTKVIPPRPNSISSFPTLLSHLQTEYDTLILELFDTRKALEETRRELSQALYQNDAAVRVIARISMERDQAKQELQRWNATINTSTTSQSQEQQNDDADNAPDAKRRRVDEEPSEEQDNDDTTGNLPLRNDIPTKDQNDMVTTWSKLHKERKPMLKLAASIAPTIETLTKSKIVEIDSKSWHKSTCKGIIHMSSYHSNSSSYILTASKGNTKTMRQLVLYNALSQVIQYTIPCFTSIGNNTSITKVDINQEHIIIGNDIGMIQVYSYNNNNGDNEPQLIGEVTNNNNDDDTTSTIVDVRLFPTNQHFCATTNTGKLLLGSIQKQSSKIQMISTFSSSENDPDIEYTCGVLHPDGLIYAAGTKSGQIYLWDFKNKTLAGKLEGDKDDAIGTITFSNNGYHLATTHLSSNKVCAWDLRKQKLIATMNTSDKNTDTVLENVSCLSYDESGKYLAYGGTLNETNTIIITTVKEWGITAIITNESSNSSSNTKKRKKSNSNNNSIVTGIVWNPKRQQQSNENDDDDNNSNNNWMIAMCNDQDRTVRFFSPNNDNDGES